MHIMVLHYIITYNLLPELNYTRAYPLHMYRYECIVCSTMYHILLLIIIIITITIIIILVFVFVLVLFYTLLLFHK